MKLEMNFKTVNEKRRNECLFVGADRYETVYYLASNGTSGTDHARHQFANQLLSIALRRQ